MTLIAYDIADPRRLSRVSKLLAQEGIRVQNSTFECHCDAATVEKLRLRLLELIDEEEDRVYIYTVSKHKNRRRGKRKSIWEMIF